MVAIVRGAAIPTSLWACVIFGEILENLTGTPSYGSAGFLVGVTLSGALYLFLFEIASAGEIKPRANNWIPVTLSVVIFFILGFLTDLFVGRALHD